MSSPSPPDGTYRVPAVARAFAILDLLSSEDGLKLADIVEHTGLNKSTCFYILRTLEAVGAVRMDRTTNMYGLGDRLMELGAAATGQLGELQVAKRRLSGLLDEMQVSIVVYRRSDPYHVVLIDKIERMHRVRVTLSLGSRIPIQGGSFGRCFLAFDPPDLVDDVLRDGLQEFTPKSVTDAEVFREELEDVRARGWSVDHEGFALGVSTVAAPVFGQAGEIRFVVAGVGLTSVMGDVETGERYGKLLKSVCDDVSSSFGWSPA